MEAGSGALAFISVYPAGALQTAPLKKIVAPERPRRCYYIIFFVFHALVFLALLDEGYSEYCKNFFGNNYHPVESKKV